MFVILRRHITFPYSTLYFTFSLYTCINTPVYETPFQHWPWYHAALCSYIRSHYYNPRQPYSNYECTSCLIKTIRIHHEWCFFYTNIFFLHKNLMHKIFSFPLSAKKPPFSIFDSINIHEIYDSSPKKIYSKDK